MTWAILSALAVFVAWHGDTISREQEIKSQYIYSRYYTGANCYDKEVMAVKNKPIRECKHNNRTDDFYIVFDTKNQTRERYRKTQLLWLYILMS